MLSGIDMKSPKVTVLMSVYNGEKYLCEAIESILNQTFTDFEFLIINDGSTDKTSEILQSYRDSRIRIIDNEGNIGLTKSLNKGLRMARGEYIARMDADDVSMPERLEMQIEFIWDNPDVGLVGCWVDVVDVNGIKIDRWELPETHGYIKWRLLFGNCIAHPASLFKTDLAQMLGGYDEKIKYAQDYFLWSKMSFETKIHQIPEVLIKRRVHPNCIGAEYLDEQQNVVKHVMRYMFSRVIKNDVSVEQIKIIHNGLKGDEIEEIDDASSLLFNLFRFPRAVANVSWAASSARWCSASTEYAIAIIEL